jgi:DNA-binding HxlR family transcriptional regulator
MGLVADGRLVWIMRELDSSPLRVVDLADRIGCIPHTTLVEKLDLLVRSGVIWREERGGRASGVVQHLTEGGHALLDLADRALERSLSAEPGAPQMVFGSPSRPPALRVLADEAGPALLLALAGSPQPVASLERSLRPLTRSQIKTRLRALELARFARCEDNRYVLCDTGREAGALLAVAARLEHRHRLPGAIPARPAHMISLLSVAAPPMPTTNGGDDPAVELVVVGEGGSLGDAARSHWLATPGGWRRAEAAPPTPSPAAAARGSLCDWCSALIDGRIAALHLIGDAPLARRLAIQLQRQLFLRHQSVEKPRVF